MAAVDDPKTLGPHAALVRERGRDRRVRRHPRQVRAGRADRRPVARLPAGARQLRPAPGRRADDPGQGAPGRSWTPPSSTPWPTSADTWSRGFGHITTRQNVQFHFLQPHDVEKAMRRLAEAGPHLARGLRQRRPQHHRLPLRGRGRGRGLRRHALRGGADALPAAPPPELLAAPQVQDRLRGLRLRGPFAHRRSTTSASARASVTASAGSAWWRAAAPRPSAPPPASCSSSCPRARSSRSAEAVIRVFHRLGDFKHKQRNRMKFLIKELGWDGWRAEFEKELQAFREEGGAPFSFPPDAAAGRGRSRTGRGRPRRPSRECAARASAAVVRGPGLVPETAPPLAPRVRYDLQWASTNVRPQRQPGFSTVDGHAAPRRPHRRAAPASSATSRQAYGDGTVRTTVRQGLLFRWVRHAGRARSVPAAGRRRPGPGRRQHRGRRRRAARARSRASWPSRSRAASAASSATRLRARPDLVAAAPDLVIKISGCPNGCGQHHVAGIGFQGSVRKVAGKALPQYFLMVGGGVDDKGAHFARLAAKVPVRRVDSAVERLIGLYRDERRDGRDGDGLLPPRRPRPREEHAGRPRARAPGGDDGHRTSWTSARRPPSRSRRWKASAAPSA